jgi:hypothetical protein
MNAGSTMKTSAFLRGLLLGAALLVGMPLSAAAKCRIMPPERLIVIDGRKATEAELTELTTTHAESVYAIEILCWNPVDGSFNRLGNGMVATSVVTKGLMEGMIDDLQVLSAAQRSFFLRNGTYTNRLSDLVGPDLLSDGISIELTATATGWLASAHKGAMVHRCAVFAGDATPPVAQRSPHFMTTQLVTQLEHNVPACFVSIDPSRKHTFDSGR